MLRKWFLIGMLLYKKDECYNQICEGGFPGQIKGFPEGIFY
jgi:hypothetical protein